MNFLRNLQGVLQSWTGFFSLARQQAKPLPTLVTHSLYIYAHVLWPMESNSASGNGCRCWVFEGSKMESNIITGHLNLNDFYIVSQYGPNRSTFPPEKAVIITQVRSIMLQISDRTLFLFVKSHLSKGPCFSPC